MTSSFLPLFAGISKCDKTTDMSLTYSPYKTKTLVMYQHTICQIPKHTYRHPLLSEDKAEILAVFPEIPVLFD